MRLNPTPIIVHAKGGFHQTFVAGNKEKGWDQLPREYPNQRLVRSYPAPPEGVAPISTPKKTNKNAKKLAFLSDSGQTIATRCSLD